MGLGKTSCTSSSSSSKAFLPGPTRKSSTGKSRSPELPKIRQTAPLAISAGMLSAAGDALQRLPPAEQRP